MTRTTLTPVTSAAHGTTLTAAAAVDQPNGNQFLNPSGSYTVIEINNGAANSINVTFTPTGTYSIASGVTYTVNADLQVVTNGTSKVFGPFNQQLMNNASGMVLVDYSSGTTITARVITVPSA